MHSTKENAEIYYAIVRSFNVRGIILGTSALFFEIFSLVVKQPFIFSVVDLLKILANINSSYVRLTTNFSSYSCISPFQGKFSALMSKMHLKFLRISTYLRYTVIEMGKLQMKNASCVF